MRIVIISDWFSENMGYAENCLPKAMAALGHEVHVITSDAQVYFGSALYKETYEAFLGPEVVACGSKELDGYTLHRLPHARWRGRLRIKGLQKKLRELRPQIVQTFDATALTTYEAVLSKFVMHFKLFTGNHVVASVFPPARGVALSGQQRRRWLLEVTFPGRLTSLFTEKCYAATDDAADIAVRFFGVEAGKVEVDSLGVDTDLFSPAVDPDAQVARAGLRQQLGFAQTEIVCIYTGRFSNAKNPLCLARAVEGLRAQGEPFRGLFIGGGEQEAVIRGCSGCIVRPFIPVHSLAKFYQAADIAVWPMQESTSMLDAAACGLPIVVSNRVIAVERVQGNGITYDEGSVADLIRVLLTLRVPDFRDRLGKAGATKMAQQYSWLAIARHKLQDYEAALGK